MTPPNDHAVRGDSVSSELRRLFDCIERLIHDGLEHGHFRYEIKGTIGKNLRRELVIEAGVSHKFTVSLDDLSR